MGFLRWRLGDLVGGVGGWTGDFLGVNSSVILASAV